MRIVILYAWGMDNAGDRAITHGTLRWIYQCRPDAKVTVVTLVPPAHAAFAAGREDVLRAFPAVEVLGNDLYDSASLRPGLRSKPGKLAASLVSLCRPRWAAWLFPSSAVIKALRDCDLVLLNGGHLLFWSPAMGERRHIVKLFLLPLLLVRRMGRRYVLHAQSFGPFNFRRHDFWARIAFRRILADAASVSVREGASRTHLAALVAAPPERPVLDAAFFLEGTDDDRADAVLREHGLQAGAFVAVTLRLSRRGSRTDIEGRRRTRYIDALGAFVRRWLERESAPLVFVCQVERDRKDTEAVLSGLRPELGARCIVADGPWSFESLRSFYQRAALLVGMRFHALVFALSMGTPVVGVYYDEIGPKIEGLMYDFACGDLSLPLDALHGERLYEVVAGALADRDTLADRVQHTLQDLRRETLAMNCRQLRAEA